MPHQALLKALGTSMENDENYYSIFFVPSSDASKKRQFLENTVKQAIFLIINYSDKHYRNLRFSQYVILHLSIFFVLFKGIDQINVNLGNIQCIPAVVKEYSL